MSSFQLWESPVGSQIPVRLCYVCTFCLYIQLKKWKEIMGLMILFKIGSLLSAS